MDFLVVTSLIVLNSWTNRMGGSESRCENGQHRGEQFLKCWNNFCQQGTQVLEATQLRT